MIDRRRNKPSDPFEDFERDFSSYEKDSKRGAAWWWPLCALAFGAFVYGFAYLNDQNLPALVTVEEALQKPHLFCGEGARNFVKRLTALGPRVFGDPANEIEAPKIIKDEINSIIKSASSVQSIQLQEQKGSGSYLLEYKTPFVNVYNEAQNIIAMIEGSDGSHSVLTNCHYDSVPMSPGGSDDAVSCAIMLEIMRVISVSDVRPKHNMVFLFNGAEETPLQAAHLFLQHEWAKKCKIFVNLEAGGVGGRQVLFQSGPQNGWLTKYYANTAPHPLGQVLGEELFQNGVIPSDTDFRIFRDFGKMPGMDFAYWQNGYIYHTSYDSDDHMQIGSYQHGGDNILALLKALGDAEELNNIEEHSKGQMVYYDFLGWFMIRYSATANIVANILAVLLAIASVMIFIGRPSRWRQSRELVYRIFGVFIGMTCAISVTSFIGFSVDYLAPYKMSWYSKPLLIFPLYWCPCLIVYILVLHLLEIKWSKKMKMSASSTTQMNLIACQVPWISLLFLSTLIGTRASALFFPNVMAGAIANIVIHITALRHTIYKWAWLYLGVHIPVFVYNMYLTLIFYMLIIPIFGRSGPVNSDLIIAFVSSVFVLFLSTFAIPLMNLVEKPKRTLYILLVFSIFIMLSLRFIGHPYSSSPTNPRPQRYLIFHTNRQFRDQSNEIYKTDNAYIIYNMDRNSPHTIPIEKERIRSVADDCETDLFCGIPMFTPRTVMVSSTSSLIPAESPNLYIDTEIITAKSPRECNSEESTCSLNLVLKGPNRLTLIVVLREGASLSSWSLNSTVTPGGLWKNQLYYFIHITSGNPECSFPLSLTFDVAQNQANGEPFVDLVLSGHYILKQSELTKEFREFLSGFPDWTHVTAWPSAHRGYVF